MAYKRGPSRQGIAKARKESREERFRRIQQMREETERRMRNKMKPGMLTGGQAKLDKNKNNKIDAQDFKILRAEKAKGRGKGLQDEKMKPGKIIKAKKSKFIERRKELMGLGTILRKDPTKAINRVGVKDRYGMDIKPKTSQLGKDLASKAARAAKATRLGKIALGVAGAALATKEYLKSKMNKKVDKKMGGGMMMQRPMMASKGKMSNRDKAEKETIKRLANAPKGGNRGAARDVVKGMGGYMGGGMMMRPNPVGYKTGKMIKARGCKLGRNKPTKMY